MRLLGFGKFEIHFQNHHAEFSNQRATPQIPRNAWNYWVRMAEP